MMEATRHPSHCRAARFSRRDARSSAAWARTRSTPRNRGPTGTPWISDAREEVPSVDHMVWTPRSAPWACVAQCRARRHRCLRREAPVCLL